MLYHVSIEPTFIHYKLNLLLIFFFYSMFVLEYQSPCFTRFFRPSSGCWLKEFMFIWWLLKYLKVHVKWKRTCSLDGVSTLLMIYKGLPRTVYSVLVNCYQWGSCTCTNEFLWDKEWLDVIRLFSVDPMLRPRIL